MSDDYSLQGKIWLGERQPNGKPGAIEWLGDSAELQIKLTTDKSPRTESYSGNRLTSAVLQKAKKADISMKPNQLSAQVVALALYGNINTIAAGTATAETLPADLAVGETLALDHGNISDLVITDATGAPVTLVEDTDYVIESAAGGLVTIKALGDTPYTQPFKAAYSYGAAVDLAMFTAAIPEKYLLFDGINTMNGKPVLARLYRCQFDPAAQVDLIGADLGELSLSGSVLFDAVNAADANLGGFGKITLPG